MVDHSRAAPLGERVATLEAFHPEVKRELRDLNDKLDRLTTDMRGVTAALERRSVAMRIGGWFAEIIKLAIAGLIGAAGGHFFAQHGG